MFRDARVSVLRCYGVSVVSGQGIGVSAVGSRSLGDSGSCTNPRRNVPEVYPPFGGEARGGVSVPRAVRGAPRRGMSEYSPTLSCCAVRARGVLLQLIQPPSLASLFGSSHRNTELLKHRNGYAQFSTLRPSTLPNSSTLFVTNVTAKLRAWAAIIRSSGPIVLPLRSNDARIAP